MMIEKHYSNWYLWATVLALIVVHPFVHDLGYQTFIEIALLMFTLFAVASTLRSWLRG